MYNNNDAFIRKITRSINRNKIYKAHNEKKNNNKNERDREDEENR